MRLRKPKRAYIEHEHQKAFIAWVKQAHPDEFELLTSMDPARKRNLKQQARAKKSGMKSGWPDIFIAVPMGPYNGFFVEFKRPPTPGKRAGRLSAKQKEMFALLTEKNYYVCVCFEWEAARILFRGYLQGKLHELADIDNT